MNILLVVIPVLVLLMLCLGLELRPADFARIVKRPRAAALGLVTQMVCLPLCAAAVALALGLPPLLAVGLILLAACPGGASSNAFTMLARGDVALSVTLTAVTSVLTVLTIPAVVNLAMRYWQGADADLQLALGPVLLQNAATILLPIGVGMAVRLRRPRLADSLGAILRKATVPLLLLMIGVFVMHQREVLLDGVKTMAVASLLLITTTMALGSLLGRIGQLPRPASTALVIEVGMQNSAQAIAIAASPFLLADAAYAVPAVVYAVIMNIVLLTYTAWCRRAAPAVESAPAPSEAGPALGEGA